MAGGGQKSLRGGFAQFTILCRVSSLLVRRFGPNFDGTSRPGAEFEAKLSWGASGAWLQQYAPFQSIMTCMVRLI